MNVRNAVAIRVRQVLEALAEGRCEVWMAAYAREALPSFRSGPAVRKRPVPSVAHVEARRAAEDAAERAETARIRVACITRAAGRGELCGRPLDVREAQMCHLDGGIGKRRQRQSERNCVMEHHDCHQGPLGFDRRPLAWLPAVTAWAERHGYPVPERFRTLEALRAQEVAGVR